MSNEITCSPSQTTQVSVGASENEKDYVAPLPTTHRGTRFELPPNHRGDGHHISTGLSDVSMASSRVMDHWRNQTVLSFGE
jgi:hypothetical protein